MPRRARVAAAGRGRAATGQGAPICVFTRGQNGV